MKTTMQFFNDFEIITYDLCKLALVDGFLRRYLKSYVGAACCLLAFEILLDRIMKEVKSGKARVKYDLKHITRAFNGLQKTLTSYFGFNKFIFFQVFGKFLRKRFSCFFFQYSGIMSQRKALLLEGI